MSLGSDSSSFTIRPSKPCLIVYTPYSYSWHCARMSKFSVVRVIFFFIPNIFWDFLQENSHNLVYRIKNAPLFSFHREFYSDSFAFLVWISLKSLSTVEFVFFSHRLIARSSCWTFATIRFNEIKRFLNEMTKKIYHFIDDNDRIVAWSIIVCLFA